MNTFCCLNFITNYCWSFCPFLLFIDTLVKGLIYVNISRLLKLKLYFLTVQCLTNIRITIFSEVNWIFFYSNDFAKMIKKNLSWLWKKTKFYLCSNFLLWSTLITKYFSYLNVFFFTGLHKRFLLGFAVRKKIEQLKFENNSLMPWGFLSRQQEFFDLKINL